MNTKLPGDKIGPHVGDAGMNAEEKVKRILHETTLKGHVEAATCPELRALYHVVAADDPRVPMPEDYIPVNVHN